MSKRCRHKRRKFTGRINVDIDERGVTLVSTAKLIYECCSCGKRVLR